MMSLPSASCTSMVDSGVNKCGSPFRCERNSTPSSVTLRSAVQTENLKSAGIRQDRPRPGHELVQAAELPDRLVAGPQEQVIGVGQDDLRVQIVQQIAREDALNGPLRADRHEDGRFDVAVGGVQDARARTGFRAGRL